MAAKGPIYRKRISRHPGMEEEVYVNCSQDSSDNLSLLTLHYIGKTTLQPHSSFRIPVVKPDQKAMPLLHDPDTGYLIFSLAEMPCEYARHTFPKTRIKPDELLFTDDCKGMVMQNSDSQPRVRYYLILDHNLPAELMFGLSEICLFPLQEPEPIMNRMKELFEMAADSPRYSEMDFSVKLFELLTRVCSPSRKKTLSAGSYESLLQKVAGYPQNYPTIASLLTLFRVSETTLKRIFRKYTGKSPMEYVICHRLDNSCWQLLNTKMSVAEIARLNGYSSTAFFSKSFKKEYGGSPALIREQGKIPKREPARNMPGNPLSKGKNRGEPHAKTKGKKKC